MERPNASDTKLTGAGREDNQPPEGYGGQQELDESGVKGGAGKSDTQGESSAEPTTVAEEAGDEAGEGVIGEDRQP
jgi:hypothetical protein